MKDKLINLFDRVMVVLLAIVLFTAAFLVGIYESFRSK